MLLGTIKKSRGFNLFILFWGGFYLNAVSGTNLFRGYKGGSDSADGMIDDVPLTMTLSNGLVMPLAGLGVGNLQRNLIENMIHRGLRDDHRLRLIDTSHASGNEREVAIGITTGVKDLKEELAKIHSDKDFDRKQRIQVHVVTKIWYTYLGYERTKMAVAEILLSFEEAINDPNVDLKLTLLIHWPQCYEDIPWMNCEEEEEQLPLRVKNAGPPPHLDPSNAWKGSWKALEDVYERHNSVDNDRKNGYSSVVASIGISNFDRRQTEALLEISRVKPHITQINVWSLMNDPSLVEIMNENDIHIQVYNVMNGMLGQIYENPKAHHHLLMVGNELKQKSIERSLPTTPEEERGESLDHVYIGQTILNWLVQFDISVIPRTSDYKRLYENSPVALSKVPALSKEQIDIAGRAMNALINNDDLEEDVLVKVRFHAKESDMFLYWVPDEGDTERQLAYIEKGSSYEESAHPGHTFKVYHAYNPDQFETYSIRGHYGDSQDIHVEL